MQIRCYSCKMPITIGRAFVNQALNIIQEDDLVYYDFRCPKCKKSNRVSKEQLLHASPAWVYEPTEVKEEKTPETVKKAEPKKAKAKKTGPKKTKTKKVAPKKAEPKKKTK